MIKRFSRRCLAACCLSCMLFGLPANAAGQVTLVENGAPNCVIVVSDDYRANTSAAWAAAQTVNVLQAHFRLMSGADIPMVRLAELGKTTVVNGRLEPEVALADTYILVGDSDLARQLGITVEPLKPSGFRLAVKANVVVLLGYPVIRPPYEGGGIRHAGVTILEQLGCAFLWPGESGKVVPKKTTLTLAVQDTIYNPPIVQRRIRPLWETTGVRRLRLAESDYGAAYTEARTTRAAELDGPGTLPGATGDLAWGLWQGLGGDSGINGGHAFGDAWEKWGKDHPAWFAMQGDGTRTQMENSSRERLCLSNPDLIAEIAKEIIAEVDANPEQGCVSICLNDGGYSSFCICDACEALDPPNAPTIKLGVCNHAGDHQSQLIDHPSLTDRVLHFSNHIAELVTAKHPDLLLLTQAYSTHQLPPVATKLHPNLVVRYVPSSLDSWDGWRAAGARRMFWRPNILWSGAKSGLLKFQAKRLATVFNRLAQDDVIATDMDSLVSHWSTQGFTYYAAARLNWNPSLTYDQLVRDFSQAGFGSAASQIADYLRRVEAEPLSLELVGELRALLVQADQLAAKEPGTLARLAFLRLGLNFTHLHLELERLNELADAGQPCDKVRTRELLTLYFLTLRDLARHHPLAVNVPIIVGRNLGGLKAIGGPGVELPFEQLMAISDAGYSLTGHEETFEEMEAAFHLGEELKAAESTALEDLNELLDVDP